MKAGLKTLSFTCSYHAQENLLETKSVYIQGEVWIRRRNLMGGLKRESSATAESMWEERIQTTSKY